MDYITTLLTLGKLLDLNYEKFDQARMKQGHDTQPGLGLSLGLSRKFTKYMQTRCTKQMKNIGKILPVRVQNKVHKNVQSMTDMYE
jgi:hypothetical protein